MSEKFINLIRGWGPVYWNVSSYRLAMRFLRPKGRADMYRLISKEIAGKSTLELCCGYGELIKWIENVEYTGMDKNPAFIHSLLNKNIRAIEGDIMKTPWPPADCLVLIDSLYHFLPQIDEFMGKVLNTPFKKAIISESIVNLSSSSYKWVAKISSWATKVDGQTYPRRFKEASLQNLFGKYGFKKVMKLDSNLIGILDRS